LVDGAISLAAFDRKRPRDGPDLSRSFHFLARESWQISSYLSWENEMSGLRRFLSDESGATAIEYGLITACIALAIITAVKGVSNNLKNTFNNVSTNLR